MIVKSFNCCIIGALSSLNYYSGAFMCTSRGKGTSPSGPVNLRHLGLSHLWQQREDQTPTAQAVVWLLCNLLFRGRAAPSSTTWEEGPGAGTYIRDHTGSQTRHMQRAQRSSRPLPSSLYVDRSPQSSTAEMCPTKGTRVTRLSQTLSNEGQDASSASVHWVSKSATGSPAFFACTRGYHRWMWW